MNSSILSKEVIIGKALYLLHYNRHFPTFTYTSKKTLCVSGLSRHQSCKGSTINQYISMQRNPAGPLCDPKLQYLVTRSFVRSKSEGTPLSADWSPLPLSTLLPTTRKSEVIGLMVSLSVIGQLNPILRSDWSKMSTSSSQPST